MCGITAIVNTTGGPVSPAVLIAVRDLASHRGPDQAGSWQHQQLGLGHRRLSILDLSDRGKQPIHYRHVVVIHNGEIYNYLGLKQELEKVGYEFSTRTDTEILAAAYCHWGADCVNRFNGIWGFVIYDSLKNQLFCSRDRFGVKPLYYASIGDYFCLASEIKQFTALKDWKAMPNLLACHEWLQHGNYERGGQTLFQGVFELPAGHSLMYDLANYKYHLQRYYYLREAIQPLGPLDFTTAVEHFRELLEQAVKLQLQADVNIALTLSGGLDSSSLAAIMAGLLNGDTRLKAYSACVRQRGYNEEPFIDAMARKHSLVSCKYYPEDSSLLAHLEKVTWHMEEPLPGPADLLHFMIFMKENTDGVKVNICGQGADEILCGYDAFYLPHWRHLSRRHPERLLPELLGFAWRHPGTIMKRLRKGIGRRGSVRLHEPPAGLFPARFTALQRLSMELLEKQVLPYILQSEDRLSMAHGIESRVPFLDHRLVEFCLGLPDEFKIWRGLRKRILRETMRQDLPGMVYRRTDKLGFEIPITAAMMATLSRLQRHREASRELKRIFGQEMELEKVPAWRREAMAAWWSVFFH